jgi:ectoine hydroxylase-related dioxygenase (phytanoyl-CoA dioxygenase family)
LAEPATTIELPALTRDLDRALEDIREFGVARIEGVLEGTILARVRDALYRAAASDLERGWNTRFIMDNPEDKTNQRVWGLLSRDPVFSDLAEHPTALHFVRAVLGWPAMLSNISANITGPGGGEMVLHADQGFAPQPWGGIQSLNVAWAIDDFTDENGATRIVPGSQRQNRAPTAEDGGHTVALEAPAGSVIVMEGRAWHRTRFNRTTAVGPEYSRSIRCRSTCRRRTGFSRSIQQSATTHQKRCCSCSDLRRRGSVGFMELHRIDYITQGDASMSHFIAEPSRDLDHAKRKLSECGVAVLPGCSARPNSFV